MAPPTVLTKQETLELFDGAAERYDREGPSIFRQFGERLVELMGFVGGERILDVATGTGAVLIPAAQRVGRYGRVVGIDLSAKMLEQAENAARELGLDNFELYQMDAEQLVFRDNIFNAVTSAFSLFFFPAMESALSEMKRVVDHRGQIGIALFGREPLPFEPGWRLFSEQAQSYGVAARTPQRVAYRPEEVEALLAAAGFIDIELRSEVSEIVYATEEDWWAFQWTLATRAPLVRLSEEVRAQFKQEYLAKLRPLFRQDGLHLHVSVIYGLSRKP